MSKKLIAVASAAALALTGLVGIAPAMASAPDIVITGGDASVGTSSSDPREITVPYNNTIDFDDATTDTAVRFVVGGVTAPVIGDVITVTSTGSVKLVQTEVDTASKDVDASTLGKTSLTFTRTNTDPVTFYAYTTKDDVGTVKIDVARTGLNTSTTYYIEGLPGVKHTITSVTGVPETLANTATATVNFAVTDIFGNVIENDAAHMNYGATISSHFSAISWDASKKLYKSTLTSSSSSLFLASIDLGAADPDGMKKSADTLAAVVNNPATATANAAATAQIAALTAQLAESRPKATSVTKKKYNTLARKWNRAFPSQKVALKK